MMKMKMWTALAVLPLLAIGSEKTISNSKATGKPAAANAAMTQASLPKWQGNTVVAGNRKVVFGDNGIIQVWCSGRQVLKISGYYSVRTPKTFWLEPESKKTFKNTQTREGNALVNTGKATVNGQTWQVYTQKAEITPEGLIRVTLNWKGPDPKLNWKFGASLNMSGAYDKLGGTQLKINQDTLTLPASHDPKAKKNEVGTFWRGKDFRITFLANLPGDAFVVYGSKANNFEGLWIQRNQLFRCLNFWSYPDVKKSGIQFDLDIRSKSK